jgi:coproporphyrinogen III oxidase
MKFLEDEGAVHLGLAGPKPLGSTVHMCNRIRFLTVPTKQSFFWFGGCGVVTEINSHEENLRDSSHPGLFASEKHRTCYQLYKVWWLWGRNRDKLTRRKS